MQVVAKVTTKEITWFEDFIVPMFENKNYSLSIFKDIHTQLGWAGTVWYSCNEIQCQTLIYIKRIKFRCRRLNISKSDQLGCLQNWKLTILLYMYIIQQCTAIRSAICICDAVFDNRHKCEKVVGFPRKNAVRWHRLTSVGLSSQKV